MSPFLQALHSGRVLLMDGAMGTELQRSGMRQEESAEGWNLTHSEQVRAVHQAYLDAGAQLILTNTFQGAEAIDRFWKTGVGHHVSEIYEAAAVIARKTSSGTTFVLFDVGPYTESSRREAAKCAVWTARAKADAILVETCSEVSDAARILKEMQRSGVQKGKLPLLVSWTFRRSASGTVETFTGQTPEACAELAVSLGFDSLGVNCGRDIGMDEIIEIVRRYRKETDLPLFARPNAGTPKRVGDQWVYPLSPSEMAARLPELLEAGVSMVGGCCGTTPAHIAAMRPVIDEWNKRRASPAMS